MDTWIWVVIGVAALVVLVAIALIARSSRKATSRSDRLRDHFGSEYDRVVHGHSAKDRRSGEAELEQRKERRESLDLRTLAAQSRTRYAGAWADLQMSFADDPERSVGAADHLVEVVMADRGYPVGGDFERQTELVSVDHPHLVSNYRNAHEVYERSRRHEANTEELRRALVHYRALFNQLLADETASPDRSAVPERSEMAERASVPDQNVVAEPTVVPERAVVPEHDTARG